MASAQHEAVRHFTGNRPKVWSAALIPAGSGRIILENTAHALCRRCSSLAHELSHHFLEHPFDDVLLTDENGCLFDQAKEKEANFLAAELLVPYQAALKAAFAEKTNDEIAANYGVSPQFAQMRMAGARKHAALRPRQASREAEPVAEHQLDRPGLSLTRGTRCPRRDAVRVQQTAQILTRTTPCREGPEPSAPLRPVNLSV